MSHYTLDQFLVFVTVVDSGGFAAAARSLGRAQSAVTYAIRGLEEQSGLILFDRSEYRPALTEAGRALLPRARRVIADFEDYRRQAEAIAQGLEASLFLVTDAFTPFAPLAEALGRLHSTFPSVRARLVVEPYSRAKELLAAGEMQLGIVMPTAPLGTDFETHDWTEHDLVAVAAPSHPLARAAPPLSVDVLREHMQLVWTPASAALDSPDLGVHALDCWHVTDFSAKLQMLRAGVGWGSMPDHLVADDIASGRLVRLELQGWEGSDRMPRYSTVIVRRKNSALGPATRFLIETLRHVDFGAS